MKLAVFENSQKKVRARAIKTDPRLQISETVFKNVQCLLVFAIKTNREFLEMLFQREVAKN